MTILVPQLISALDAALVAFLWQGVAAALLLWFALVVLRPASANARYLAGCLALAVLAFAPAVTAWFAYQTQAPAARYALILARPAIDRLAAAQGDPSTDWLTLARAWMLPAWACGVLLLSMRMLWGCTRISRLRRQGEAPDAAIIAMAGRIAARVRVTRPVRVLVSSLADGPSVVGWLRPVLLLPAATVLGLSPEQLEAVLAHELAHVRRYDYLVNLLQMLIETLFFYHPAVWWISRRIRMERELCCDDVAVLVSGDAVCYARALASLERMRVATTSLALGVKDGPLLYRIERLLGAAPRDPAPSRLPGLIAVCLGLACLAPGVNPVRAQAPLPMPMPMPPAALVSVSQVPAHAVPTSAVRHVLKPAAHPPMQVVETNAQPVPLTSAEDVLVEVTVGQSGVVNDARVINGPMVARRQALITALNLRFPQSAPQTLYVTVPPTPAAFLTPGGVVYRPPGSFQPVLTQAEAQQRLYEANADVARLRALQVDASDRGRAQLEEAIQQRLGRSGDLQAIADGKDPLVGVKLAYIRITGAGATGDVVRQVLAQLPFRSGDVLSNASMQAAVNVVRQNYSGATALFGSVTASGEGVFLVTLPYPASVR